MNIVFYCFFSFLLFLSQKGGGSVVTSVTPLWIQQRYLHERGPLRDNIDRIVTFFFINDPTRATTTDKVIEMWLLESTEARIQEPFPKARSRMLN